MTHKDKESVKAGLRLFEAHARVSTLKVTPRIEAKRETAPMPPAESGRPRPRKGER